MWKSKCGKVLSFPQFSGSAPAPEPPGTRPFAEEESASALLPRSFRFLKKEMKFLLTNEKLRSSSSSAGKNGKAPRPVFLAVSPCLEAAASLSSARFRLYHIVFPAGQKVKLQTPPSIFMCPFLPKNALFLPLFLQKCSPSAKKAARLGGSFLIREARR